MKKKGVASRFFQIGCTTLSRSKLENIYIKKKKLQKKKKEWRHGRIKLFDEILVAPHSGESEGQNSLCLVAILQLCDIVK